MASGGVSPKGERFLFGPFVDARWELTYGQLLLRVGYRMPEASIKVRETSYQVKPMPIPESTLSSWSHHQAGTASKQRHVSVRDALAAYDWPPEVKYEVFLQGSYKNDTNLRRDSDVDVVVRLASKLRPRVALLTGEQL